MNCPICKEALDGINSFTVPFLNTKEWHREYSPEHKYTYCFCRRCGVWISINQRLWEPIDFANNCYNESYADFDGDILNPNGNRPTFHKNLLLSVFQHYADKRVLDYGCGRGYVVQYMSDTKSWGIEGYDPYYGDSARPVTTQYDLITAFEVLEHLYDIVDLFNYFYSILNSGGVVYATTDVTDLMPDVRHNYYTCPRVGHVMLHSYRSLGIIAKITGFNVIHLPKDEKHGIQGHLFIKERTV